MHNILTLAGAPVEASAPLFDNPAGYAIAAALLWGTYLVVRAREARRARRDP